MRIMWLKSELLHPVDRGGRIRTYQMLRELKKEHRVTYVALHDPRVSDQPVTFAQEYCHELITVPHRVAFRGTQRFLWQVVQNMVSSLPFPVWRCRSKGMRRVVANELLSGHYDVVVCDFLFPFVNVPDELRVPLVLFQHNVEALIWKRHAVAGRNLLERMYLRMQWRRMKRYEGVACREADGVVAVSEDDRRRIEEDYGALRVMSVPTGVDWGFFAPAGIVARRQHEIIFTGAMDWLPNERGVMRFVEDIFPKIRARVPDALLTVVGRNPSDRLVRLTESLPGVTVTGFVPDVRPFLHRGGVFVVPLTIGGGTRLKILEAMAAEIPVVSSTVGAEGLGLVSGDHLLLSDDPDDFAELVVRAIRDPASSLPRVERAARLVRERHGWANATKSFAEFCQQAIRTRDGVGFQPGSVML